ncbi:MAG: Na(+)/H(+) antiporter subunit B [Deinococcus sp.]|nr:Na(+)/H(+) antiporter subunit B [Deinococcus sp.]
MSPKRIVARVHHARKVHRKVQTKVRTPKAQEQYQRARFATPKERAMQRAAHFLADNAEDHEEQRTDATTAWTAQASQLEPVDGSWELSPEHEDLRESLSNDPIVNTVTMPAFALLLLMTLLMFWRGHQLPGGGFVGGALTVCALLLYRISAHSSALNINFTRLIPLGLSIAFMTGLVPYLLNKGFLKSDYGYLTTFVTGEFEWASAMLFDLGVFLTVLGGAMTITESLIDIAPTELTEDDR